MLKKAGYSVTFLLIIFFTLNYSTIFAKASNLYIEMNGHPISIPEGETQTYINKDGRTCCLFVFLQQF
jgi:hypothetical protein